MVGPRVPEQVGEVLHAGLSGILPADVAVQLSRKPSPHPTPPPPPGCPPALLGACLQVLTWEHSQACCCHTLWETACREPARLSGIHVQGAQAETHWCVSPGKSTPHREAPSSCPMSAGKGETFPTSSSRIIKEGNGVDGWLRGNAVTTSTILKSKRMSLFCSGKCSYIISLIIASFPSFPHFSMVFRTSISQMLGFLD